MYDLLSDMLPEKRGEIQIIILFFIKSMYCWYYSKELIETVLFSSTTTPV